MLVTLLLDPAYAEEAPPQPTGPVAPVVEGPLPPPTSRPLTTAEIEQVRRVERAYHTRLIVFGSVSLAGGAVAMALSKEEPILFHAGLHNAIGGAANLAFGAIAMPIAQTPQTVDRLAHLRQTMALNVGLDAGYVATGLAMGLLGDEHVAIEGAGWGIAIQGAQLLICDAIFLAKLPKPR